ncbi:MAG: tetratricopeptide repeat protein [Candidatus Firestonebacteria bacterium]
MATLEKMIQIKKKDFTDKAVIVLLVVLLLCLSNLSYAGIKSKIDKGNKLYKKGKYEDALSKYLDAQIDEPESTILHFNSGDAKYKLEKNEEAIKEFEKATYSKDIKLQSKSYYNIGNSLYRLGKLPESIQFYKKCLELTPNDKDAKYNYEFVQKKIKENMDKNKESKESKEGKESKESKESEKGKEKKESKESEKSEKEEKKDKMAKEDAERVLKALESDEKKAMEQKKQSKDFIWGEVEEDW